ncbi:MAG: long-chain-fatty-acid--CoA ligase [Acidimicrobiia bacterium]|nr:long-chain-fatty-acid--CoA ligase [Acidimicrobiia bacterium]
MERTAEVFGDKVGFVQGGERLTYRQLASETTRLANAFRSVGVVDGDRIAYLSPNTAQMLIAHFAVPLAKAVLVAINTRLSSPEVLEILKHSGARLLVVDESLRSVVEPILNEAVGVERVVVVPAEPTPESDYANFLAAGSDDPIPWRVDDERRAISINYTSGTTGRPKGVQYTHRGAYLNALTEIIHSRHSPESVYLWTLPMFHCNGWCTTWGVTAVGGTHVGLRAVDPEEIWRLINAEGVSHLNAAPTVLISLVNHPAAVPFGGSMTITTAGAPPSPTIISQIEDLGAAIVHVYGLTETYGPHTICEYQPAWDGSTHRATLLARQGVSFIGVDPIRVVDDDMNDVPLDGTTMGEVVMRGNNVMAGYYNDPEATAEAFRGGWFHSGDVAVWHPDGYIELRDRSKDIIISGGENISTIEVEQAVMAHPAVLEAAVVAIPHEKWGERPKAFVVAKPGAVVDPEEIIAFVKTRIARFKAPDAVEIVEQLPKTSTGKIQKYVLREQEWGDHARRIN